MPKTNLELLKSGVIYFICVVMFALITTTVAFAADGNIQSESSQDTGTHSAQSDRISGEYFKGYLTDSGKILISPASWDSRDWLTAGLVIGATSGLFIFDEDMREFSLRHQGKGGDALAKIGNIFGDPTFTVPSLGMFYLYGYYYEDPRSRQTSLLAVESIVISGAFTLVLKTATQSSRPNSGDRELTWYGHRIKTLDSSFPSGHTTVAFALASVIAEEYKGTAYVPPIAYGLAVLTACARIYDNKHWASDVAFGGAIGYFVGKTVVRYHTPQTDSPISILPTFSKQGLGMIAEYRF
ncbi:MAG: phosphatase PAP2 family protein [Desulfuromonadaceae bacterium]|nr:phosphatase PAP2 family protein [Desulfuromonadaceae bacterium]MDD5104486.1 phosphatase PAP2 family protein [Desulfuromonadaceae bacterium]